MTNYKVSVVIPVYDTSSNLLSECFQSIINQTYKNYEVFIVNDASKKFSTLQFINKYVKDHSQFHLINISGQNRGPGYARNLGVKASTGDIIVYVDADDALVPICLEKVVDMFNQFPDLDIFSYENRVLLVTGKYRNTMIYTFNTNEPISVNSWSNAILDKPSVWAKAYRKKFLIDNDISFLEIDSYMEDLYYLILSYSKAKKIMFKPDTYYILRENLNSRSLSTFTTKKLRGLLNSTMKPWEKIQNDNSFISNNYYKLFPLFFSKKLADHKITDEMKNSEEYKQILQEAKDFELMLKKLHNCKKS